MTTTTAQAPCPSGLPHWWRIESPNGPTSKASCKRCHRARTYKNTSEDTYDSYNRTYSNARPLLMNIESDAVLADER